ncbi:putative reverse transcriptase zinc-binding domain-containing protein [Arabidopsis thaliana]
MDRLPVKMGLTSWGMQLSSDCVFCNSAEENRDHLLLHYTFSEENLAHLTTTSWLTSLYLC